jgi:hypothetical protein
MEPEPERRGGTAVEHSRYLLGVRKYFRYVQKLSDKLGQWEPGIGSIYISRIWSLRRFASLSDAARAFASMTASPSADTRQWLHFTHRPTGTVTRYLRTPWSDASRNERVSLRVITTPLPQAAQRLELILKFLRPLKRQSGEGFTNVFVDV